MKSLLLSLLTVCLVFSSWANELNLSTKAQTVTIYHSGALVVRTAQRSLPPGRHDLIFRGLSSKIVLNSLKVANREVTVLNKILLRKLTDEEKKQLNDRQSMLQNQLRLIESKYQEQGFVTKVEELEKLMEYYQVKILAIKRELREVQRQLEAAKALENIELSNEDAAILKLSISVEKSLSRPFEMQYVCGGIGWSSAYEINAQSASDTQLELKYLAKTMSQTGEDWKDITIKLSSSFPLASPTALPQPEAPWVLDRSGYYEPNQQQSEEAMNQNQQIARLEGIEYEEILIPSFLKVRTLEGKYSIQSNSTVFTFPILTTKLPARFYYYGFPGLDTESYLVAELTGWDTIGFVDGIANIRYNNNELGKSILKFSESRDTLLLPIGRDNSLFMKRKEIADKKYFQETRSGRKKTITYAYRYQLKNNNAYSVTYVLADQVPVSQHRDVDVELNKLNGAQHNKETGDVAWKVTLEPGQAVTKELIFTLDMDAYYTYSSRRNLQFRKVSRPKF
ncbi:MAG: DUF4139 domain-containing protein [Salibacteraceae bacterium]